MNKNDLVSAVADAAGHAQVVGVLPRVGLLRVEDVLVMAMPRLFLVEDHLHSMYLGQSILLMLCGCEGGRKVVLPWGLPRRVMLSPFLRGHGRIYKSRLCQPQQSRQHSLVLDLEIASSGIVRELSFFLASTACISGLFAHLWLTAGAIARRHALGQAGAHGGVGYAARLAEAEAEARRLSAAEWAHVGLVAD